MRTDYIIALMDGDDSDLAYKDLGFNKKESIKYAKLVLKDPEYLAAGMVKVEVRRPNGAVEWDKWVD